MSYIIALDVGDKRVGVAIGTRDPITCRPHQILPREAGFAEKEILKLVSETNAELLVVGLPLSEDGSSNDQCHKIEKFCRRIQKRCNIQIQFVDEYGSSEDARDIAISNGTKSKDLKEIDDLAAAVILKRFLSSV